VAEKTDAPGDENDIKGNILDIEPIATEPKATQPLDPNEVPPDDPEELTVEQLPLPEHPGEA
jgi:hypothetical protein